MDNRRNYLLTMASGFAGLVITFALGIISTPMSLGYWDTERFGLWAIIMNLASYLNISNFGVSTAAGVLVAKNNDIRDKRRILERSLRILIASVLICGSALAMLFYFSPSWVKALGKVPEALYPEARETVYVIVVFYLIGLPLSLFSATINGFQRGYVENVFTLLSTIGFFISLVITIATHGNLVGYAAMNGTFNLMLQGGRLAYLMKSGIGRQLRIARKADRDYIPSSDTEYGLLIKSSLRFFLIWVAATLVWNTDNFVVSNVIGLSEVTPYSITFKLYNLMFSAIFVINNSVLPIIGREIGNQNWEWIGRTYRRLIRIVASFGGLACVGGIAFGHDFILLWTGSKGYAGILILVVLGVYSYLLSMVNLNASLLNSFNYTKGMYVFSFLEGIVKITTSILFGKLIGLAGIALGTMLGALCVPTFQAPYFLQRRSGGKLKIPLREILVHFCCCLLPCAVAAVAVQSMPSLPARLSLGVLVVLAYIAASVISWGGDLRGFAVDVIRLIFSGLKKKRT